MKRLNDAKTILAAQEYQKQHPPKAMDYAAIVLLVSIIAEITLFGLCVFQKMPWTTLWYPCIGLVLSVIIAAIGTFKNLQQGGILNIEAMKQEEQKNAEDKVEEILKKYNLKERHNK